MTVPARFKTLPQGTGRVLRVPLRAERAQPGIPGCAERRGFALVVSLMLVALVVLVIFAVAMSMRVDTEGGASSRAVGEARQNALLGLNTALGDLQTYAGPDQRVTARADIVGNGWDQPYWTGVWTAAPDPAGATPFERGEAPHWLVSTLDAADPVAGPGDDEEKNVIEIVGAATAGVETVAVDKISILAEDGEPTGEFAFWVADEGVKANLAVGEPAGFEEFRDGVELIRRLNAPHQIRWEPFLGGTGRVEPETVNRLVSIKSVPLVDGFDPLQERFHDFTATSAGVLADTRNGGLKKDLTRILATGYSGTDFADTVRLLDGADFPLHADTNSPPSNPDGPTWGLLRSYYNLGTQTGVSGQLASNASVRPQSATAHGVFPILGMVEMNWSVRVDPETPDSESNMPLQVVVQPVVVLINPYNVTLAAEDYRLKLRFTDRTVEGKLDGKHLRVGGSFRDNPQFSFQPSGPGGGLFGDGSNILLNVADVAFEPGEARIFSMPTGGDMTYSPGSGGIALESGLNMLDVVAINTSATIPRIDVEADPIMPVWLTWARVTASLYETGSGNRLQHVEDIYYTTTPPANTDLKLTGDNAVPNRLILRDSGRDMVASGAAGFDFTSGARWLTHYNIRAPRSRRPTGGASGYWVANPLYQGLRPAISPYNDPDVYLGVAHTGDNAYWADNINGGETHAVLFEIPRQPIVSLGALQHANLSLESWYPAYAVANSWASPYFEPAAKDFSYALNEALFDRFFFSGLPHPATGWPEDNAWLHPRLRPIGDAEVAEALDADRAAAHLSLRGAFNANSTSVAAWTALLQALQGRSVPVSNPLGATASPVATNLNTPYPRSQVPSGDGTARWRGFRDLTAVEIESLAQNIVQQVRERGPFRSLAEFVNRDLNAPTDSERNLKGALQAAIDDSTINQWWTTNDPHVPPFADRQQVGSNPLPQLPYPEAEVGPRSTAAPGYLTQADLLTVLAPVLAARSDTFLVRAYGNTLNRATGDIKAEAWCEAIVQRFPDYVDPSDPPETGPTVPENERFGRDFRIVSFRWLNSDEI